MSAGSQEGQHPVAMVWLVMGIIFLVLIGALYDKFHGPINGAVFAFIHAWMTPFSAWDKVQHIRGQLERANPDHFGAAIIWQLFDFAGVYWRWPMAAALLVMAGIHMTVFAKVWNRRTRFTYMELMREYAKVVPAIAPVVNRKRPITEEPLDSGPWMLARSPIQFAAQHSLILDSENRPVPREWLINAKGTGNEDSPIFRMRPQGNEYQRLHVDEAKARSLLAAQCGARFMGVDKLPPHRAALAACFLAFAAGDKKGAQVMFDQLSLSFREPEKPGMPFTLDTSGVDELLNKYRGNAALERVTREHGSLVGPWFMGMFEAAKKSGVIASAEFIWLRPLDRPLFYTLNQVGSRTAMMEAAGPFAHHQAEKIRGVAIDAPYVDSAVWAFEEALRSEGWLPMPLGAGD